MGNVSSDYVARILSDRVHNGNRVIDWASENFGVFLEKAKSDWKRILFWRVRTDCPRLVHVYHARFHLSDVWTLDHFPPIHTNIV